MDCTRITPSDSDISSKHTSNLPGIENLSFRTIPKSAKIVQNQNLKIFANQQSLQANGHYFQTLHQKIHLGEKTAKIFTHPSPKKSKNSEIL